MDLVAVDVGNTTISCGIFRGGILVDTWHHSTTEPEDAAAAIAEKANGMGVAVSSVVPSSSEPLAAHLRACGKRLFEVRPETHRTIRGIYPTIGSDRLANAVGAWKLYGKDGPVIALDMGSATTLTAVSSDGQFRGGFITLGLGQTITSLHEQFTQLPVVEVGGKLEPVTLLAFDTRSAVSTGTLLGHVGIIEKWIEAARKLLGGLAVTVATGGWSSEIARHTCALDFVDPVLTLKGVYLIAELEAGRAGPG